MKGRFAISTDVPCSNANLAIVKEAMDKRLQSAQCVENGNCTQEVQATCEQSSRKRRATQTIGITIELQANLLFDGSGLNFDGMINGEGEFYG
ncbi:hypothetical protein DPMN_187609 [Dreissena polymorpha]|uniref:Uncharacterized protein n=1 Tax=Dreissena polymorpha TaxID=45954 RepID=A0A9D4IAL0_DREPO|nr:hypothetical protein DPMN_187609 [Dreissena polymorpha]